MDLRQAFLQRLQIQPVCISGDRNQAQVVIAEYAQGQKIGWFLDKDGIAGEGEKCAEQVQPRGGTGGDEQVTRIDRDPIACAQKFSQYLPEGGAALFRAILQERGVTAGKAGGGGLPEQLKRQERKGRVTQTEVDETGGKVGLRDRQRKVHAASINEVRPVETGRTLIL